MAQGTTGWVARGGEGSRRSALSRR
jgi:hypothetical protein